MADPIPLFPRPGDASRAIREAPANPLAEAAVLGAILHDNSLHAKIGEFLRPEHFADPVNGTIFRTAGRMIGAGGVADPVTLKSELEGAGILEEVGGTEYLVRLLGARHDGAAVREYARVVLDAWVRRCLAEELSGVINLCYAPPDGGVPEVLGAAEATISRLREARGEQAEQRGRSLDEALDRALDMAGQAHRGEVMAGRSTGMRSVDDVTGGFEEQTFTVLGGRPGSGKSALGAQWCVSVARACRDRGERAGVGIFSLEMPASSIGRRVISALSRVSVLDLKRGAIGGMGDRLVVARKELAGLPIWIEDAGGQQLSGMRLKARAMRQRFGRLALLMVDHIHIVQPEGGNGRSSRTDDVERISNTLMAFAKEFECPVLGLAQLNRGSLERDDKRPNLSDLRQCGAIEQDADVVGFVHREEMFLPKGPPVRGKGQGGKEANALQSWQDAVAAAKGKAELIFDKVRDGEAKVVPLLFDGATTSFSEPDAVAPLFGGAPPDLGDWDDRHF